MSKYSYGRGAGFNYGGRSKYDYDDDYYGGGYKSKYGNSYSSGWSWGNFGSSFSYAEEDDDDDLYIKNHESYFTPKNSVISDKLKHSENTKHNRQLIKEMSRYFFYNMMADKEYFDEKYADHTKLTEDEIAQFEQKKSFYDDLWDKFVPGLTPLDKALAIFAKLVEEKKDQTGQAKGDVDETQLDVNEIQFHEEIYNDPVFNELLDSNHFSKQHKMDILNKISLIKNLGSQFKIEKEIEEKIVANSQIITKKIMRDYSQLGNIDLYQKLMPTFNLKLLTKDLIVNVPVDRTEHKQKIIILVDYSGSMHEKEKQEWVVALMVDRLRYVIKEEAEVFFSYFINDISQMKFHHLYNRKTVMDFWMQFSTEPNGGDTRLGVMVNHIKESISKKQLHNLNVDLSEEMPEILAINDGQDSVKTNQFVYKTNAISVMDGPNKDLKKLCVANDGKYVYVSGKEAKTWSKAGEQLLKI